MAEDGGVRLDLSVARAAVSALAKSRAKPNFGNAGSVANMLSQAKLRMQSRLLKARRGVAGQQQQTAAPGDEECLTLGDFDLADPSSSNNAGGARGGERKRVEDFFSDLVGFESLVERLRGFEAVIALAESKGQDPREHLPFNFLFVGAPGTGAFVVPGSSCRPTARPAHFAAASACFCITTSGPAFDAWCCDDVSVPGSSTDHRCCRQDHGRPPHGPALPLPGPPAHGRGG